jgi:hypothetical protein
MPLFGPSQTEIIPKNTKLANIHNMAIEAKFRNKHNADNTYRTRPVINFGSKNPNYIKQQKEREERFKEKMNQEKTAKEKTAKEKTAKEKEEKIKNYPNFDKKEKEIHKKRRNRGDDEECDREPFEEFVGYKRVVIEDNDCAWKLQKRDPYIRGGYIKTKRRKTKRNKRRKTRTRK